jgi:LacI family transcriptional regulator
MRDQDKHKDVTIRELAARLALSTATVSRALNQDSGVKKQTRKRVFELAKSLGYRTNDHAKNLRNGRSQMIGCIVPRLDNYLISTVIAGMETAARREEYCMMVMQAHGSAETEAFCTNFLFNKRVDGLMVVSSGAGGEPLIYRPFIQKNLPVILLGHAERAPGSVNVLVDDRRAGYEMTQHLLAQGRRRIVHITSDGPGKVYSDRFEGYKRALADAGIPVAPQYIMKCGLTSADGIAAAAAICQLQPLPDAIFAASDRCAAGCLMLLNSRGVRVPAQIAVGGFDDDPVASVVQPGLTTMSYPGRLLGETAVNQMMRYDGPNTLNNSVETILLRSRIVIRGSTVII